MGKGATDASEYWCAAGHYAQAKLAAPWSSRLFIARGRGPSDTTGRKSAVQFTLDPVTIGVTPIKPEVFFNRLTPGDNMSLQQALSHCQKRITRP